MTKGRSNVRARTVRSRQAPRQHEGDERHKKARWASRVLNRLNTKIAARLGALLVVAGVLGLAALSLDRSAQTEILPIDRSLLGSKANLTSTIVGTTEGYRAPVFQLTSIDGREIVYNSGKPRVFFFMASWCTTCVPEERALARLHRKYGDRVEIVSVDIDLRNDTVADLQRFQQRFGGDWPHALNVELATLLRVRSLDATYVLNRHNVITYLDIWPTNFETLESEVLKVLPANSS